LQYGFINFFSFHFLGCRDLGWKEEVEEAGREEDLEVVGWEESSVGGQEDSEEEGHEDGAELDDEGVG
jgi:hypothetical protein